jgi:hypothetical protein
MGCVIFFVMLRRILPLLFLLSCSNPVQYTINEKDLFFNATIVDAILNVEEAQRGDFLKQYADKEIVGRGKVTSVHETLATEETSVYGKLEVLVADPNVASGVGVEYRLYVSDAEGKELRHKTINIAFTGAVKKAQWVKEGNRVLRVYVVASKIEPRS